MKCGLRLAEKTIFSIVTTLAIKHLQRNGKKYIMLQSFLDNMQLEQNL